MATLNVNVKSARFGILTATISLQNIFSYDKYAKFHGEITVDGKRYHCHITWGSAEKRCLLYMTENKGNSEFSNFYADFNVPKGYKPAMELENPNIIEESIQNGYDFSKIEVRRTNTGLHFEGFYVWNNTTETFLSLYSLNGKAIEKGAVERIFKYIENSGDVSGFEKVQGTYHFDGYEIPATMAIKFSIEAYNQIYPIIYAKQIEREAHVAACLLQAKETNQRVLVRQYTADSEYYGNEDESSTCTVYVWAMPDGKIKETVNHHY